jgi:hypothetical protein
MSVHDNSLIGYTVDGSARRIELRTERREPGQPHERVDVIFEGVEAYAFRYDCLSNIICDVCEQPLDTALQAHWSEFDAGHRASGWPRFWQGDEPKTREMIAKLARDGAKWFELSSSYGMEGWVLCHSFEVRVLPRAL